MTLADASDRLAALHGDREFVTEELRAGQTRSLTFVEAADRVARWSAAIAARSRPCEPVVVAGDNGIDQFLICLAVARAGGLPVPVNAQMTRSEVTHVIADSGADLVIRSADELTSGPGSRTDPHPPYPVDSDDVAALFYTSGTTGKPKGAMLSHRSLVSASSRAALWPAWIRRDTVMLSLPVAHIMGFSALLTSASAGVGIYFLPRFSAKRVLDVIESERLSAFMGVPAMFRLLLEAGASERDLTSVRLWISGADVMAPDVARRFKSFGATACLPGIGAVGEATFIEGYGMVEVGGGVAAKLSPPFLPVGLGDSLGVTMPGWRFRVVDDDGEPTRPGQVGQLLVRGPGLQAGYWGDREASSALMTDDGWLRTGDLARPGPLGSVVFSGRSKNVIMSGGYSVYPVEIEAALEEHPGVAEAGVIGYPDRKLGEVPVAAVRRAQGSTVSAPELGEWVRGRLAHYKVPRRLVFVDELPRNATRKVRRNELMSLFADS